ncbi:hypothetical protein AKJ37_07900 [candidate division MSBL1 archaeon SCGC-AAA259I09]|uniref:Uncharacterized protein n=1 Tax=candidate division MSBL1 archaeon SCGC-AAA259I09 TaxID=1698267 RepID=A0A133UIZ0_9EURY|nr:hypothetical protein AKJ37_07900 [candidate division MSBL1 archaeon SCGC-AAA259I09]
MKVPGTCKERRTVFAFERPPCSEALLPVGQTGISDAGLVNGWKHLPNEVWWVRRSQKQKPAGFFVMGVKVSLGLSFM